MSWLTETVLASTRRAREKKLKAKRDDIRLEARHQKLVRARDEIRTQAKRAEIRGGANWSETEKEKLRRLARNAAK